MSQRVRDYALLCLGTGMLAIMTWRDSANPLLVGAALMVLGIPTGISAFKLYRGKTETPGIHGESSSPVQHSSQPP